MKILFIFSGLPHYYNLVLSRLNKIEDYKIYVIIPEESGKTIGAGVYQTTKGAEFDIIRVPEYKTYYGKPFFKGISKIIEKIKPDIVITGWPYIIGFWAVLKLRALKKRLDFKLLLKDIPFNLPKYQDAQRFYFSTDVFPDENLNPQHFKKSIKNRIYIFLLTELRKRYLRYIDGVVAYIEEAYEIFGSYGVPKDRIFLTYNSPDTDYLLQIRNEMNNQKVSIDYNPFRLIHVGRLVKWKRVDMLIEAVKELKIKYPDIELYIIGTGPEEKKLKDLSAELKLGETVKFLGGVYDTKQLGFYLMSSAVYVLAGMGGLSINEAMCFGKPVICSVCDGTEKNLIINNVNGLFFNRDDLEDLIKKINNLLSDPEKVRQMGSNSESFIREKININSVIEGYKKAFNSVAGKI